MSSLLVLNVHSSLFTFISRWQPEILGLYLNYLACILSLGPGLLSFQAAPDLLKFGKHCSKQLKLQMLFCHQQCHAIYLFNEGEKIADYFLCTHNLSYFKYQFNRNILLTTKFVLGLDVVNFDQQTGAAQPFC